MSTTDWKDALAALGSTNKQETSNANQQKNIERKKRKGVVYSTNPDFEYTDNTIPQDETLPKQQQRLRLNMEKVGRGGKTVTIIRGFVGQEDDLKALGKLLKQKCGVGGAVKDGEIIIQGDHHQRLVEILKAEGYIQSK